MIKQIFKVISFSDLQSIDISLPIFGKLVGNHGNGININLHFVAIVSSSVDLLYVVKYEQVYLNGISNAAIARVSSIRFSIIMTAVVKPLWNWRIIRK